MRVLRMRTVKHLGAGVCVAYVSVYIHTLMHIISRDCYSFSNSCICVCPCALCIYTYLFCM